MGNLSTLHHHPFGMMMEGRSFSNDRYRFGFNGQENTNEVNGTGSTLDFGSRIYNSRIGNFLSIDPDQKIYSSWSTYNFAQRSPLSLIDLNGKGARAAIRSNKSDGSLFLQITATIYVYSEIEQINAEINNYAEEIQDEINDSWNNVGSVFHSLTGINLPVVFDIKVVATTYKNVQTIAQSNKSNDVNFVRLGLETNAAGTDESWSLGNSGSWSVTPLRRPFSYAHEFGHILGNRLLEKTGIPDPNGKLDHTFSSVKSVFSNYKPTLNDLKSLNFGLGILSDSNPKSIYAIKASLKRGSDGKFSKTFGQVNNNKVFEDYKQSDTTYGEEQTKQLDYDAQQPE